MSIILEAWVSQLSLVLKRIWEKLENDGFLRLNVQVNIRRGQHVERLEKRIINALKLV